MAKGIDIIGNLKGKRGGVVYYRANGEQISRAKVTPKNPKSAKQAVQRMVLATAAKMAAAYGPIVDHSWEGVPVGRKSLQYFRSQAMQALRSSAAVYLNEPGATLRSYADFALKGSPIVGALSGLKIARGSLPINDYHVEPMGGSANLVLAAGASMAPDDLSAITSDATYRDELALLGLEPGDQLTVVYLLQNPDVVVASFRHGDSTEEDHQQAVRYARIVFAPSLPANLPAGSKLVIESDGNFAFNPAFIAESAGNFPTFLSGGSTGPVLAFNAPLAGWDTIQACAIRSQKQDDGTYRYSTAQMMSTEETFDYNDAWPVYLSYMAGAEDINVGDNLYLQHAEATPFR